MNRNFILTLFFLLLVFSAFGQNPEKKYNRQQQTWLAYLNQTRFSDKWGIWLDVHYRRTGNFIDKSTQAIFRPGITYYITDRSKLTLGYAYVHHFPAKGHENIAQPEHRIWQQFQWHQKFTGFNTMQWIRLEERYRRKIRDNDNLAEGYNFNYRVRYNFAVSIPLKGKTIEPGSFFLFLNDELHVNFGKEIVNNYFDQNRAFVGLAYQLDTHSNIQLGYMNVFQQLASGNSYNSTHAIRLFLLHNLDFRSTAEH